MPQLSIVLLALGVLTGCGLIGQTISPTILEGQQYTHSIEFPSGFQVPDGIPKPFVFDHYGFRTSVSLPDALLVTACGRAVLSAKKFEPSSEVCSPKVFIIDIDHAYAVRLASESEWNLAVPVKGQKEIDAPYQRNLREEMKKPPNMQPIPIDPSQGRGAEYQGYTYHGEEYRRRGDWVVSLNFGDSEDGKLVILAGVDNRKLPKYGFLGDPVSAGAYGLVTLDIFNASPSHRLAAIDLDSHVNVNLARRRISLVNSRWVAIGLSGDLRKMLLFDFK